MQTVLPIEPVICHNLINGEWLKGEAGNPDIFSPFNGKKIGVCFNVSVCDELPHESHDVAVDKIVTEIQIYNASKSEGVRKWN